MHRSPPADRGHTRYSFGTNRAHAHRITRTVSFETAHAWRVPALATKSNGSNGNAAATGGDRAKNGIAPAQQDVWY